MATYYTHYGNECLGRLVLGLWIVCLYEILKKMKALYMYVYEYLPWKQGNIAINTVDVYRTILLEIYKHTNIQMQIVMSPIILLFRGKNIKKGKSF